jgi:hypothetical protein
MKKIGYLFKTIQEAELAIEQLNNHWELPKENALSKFDLNLFGKFKEGYFCNQNEEWHLPVFGEPKEHELTFEDSKIN